MKPRTKFLLSKLVRYTIIALIVLTICFILPRLMPGDPLINMFGEEYYTLDEQTKEYYAKIYGLDKSLPEQYIRYLFSIFTLDFGYSIHLDKDVAVLLSERIPWTAAVVAPAVVIGGFMGLYAGVYSGYNLGKRSEKILTGVALALYVLPGFFVAMIFLMVFSYHLDWFPLGHASSGKFTGLVYFVDVIWHLMLPILVLTLMGFSSKQMVLKGAVTQIMDENFIVVAKSKGLSEGEVLSKHVMRNVYPTFVSMMALSIGFIVSGSILIEMVFSLRGMGVLFEQAIAYRDYPVTQGVFIVITMSVLASNFIAEALYGVLDPRIGDSGGGRKA